MIRIENLVKSFGKRVVLNGVTVEIPPGQATGIIGPNGSGKTTLIKTLLGLVKPDSGAIYVNGCQLEGDCQYRQNIGYMPQVARYPESMLVRELFSMIRGLRDRKPLFEQELIERFGIGSELEKPLRVLSGGNRQKVGAALAMMFNPELLFFDEPTAGLDPQASLTFKEQVQKEKERGKTVLITSHIMSELEQLCDHLLFILEGSVRYYGTMKNLLEQNREEHLERAVARLMEGAAA